MFGEVAAEGRRVAARLQARWLRAAGWQIGSDPTASKCKLTVGRLNDRSRRWGRSNAEAIAALDFLERGQQWRLHFSTPNPTAA